MNLDKLTIGIAGLGLMGGSLAMALTNKVNKVIGYDRDSYVVHLAADSGIVNDVCPTMRELIIRSDLLILAVPIQGILAILNELKDMGNLGSVEGNQLILLDLGSTKREIAAKMNTLPDWIIPIGGHPMCGKETGGLSNAQADLYQGANFPIIQLERTTDQALDLTVNLIRAIGAKPILIDVESHDRLAATSSHLPYLASLAVASTLETEAQSVAGPGLRSMTRLAETPPEMMIDILMSNRDNVLDALDHFTAQLTSIREHLQKMDKQALTEHMQKIRAKTVEFYKETA